MRGETSSCTVSLRVVGFIFEALATLGIDAAPLAAGLVADGYPVGDVDGRIPATRYAQLWDEITAVTGDDTIGIRVADAIPFGARDLVDYICRSAETLGEAWLMAGKVARLLDSTVLLHVARPRPGILELQSLRPDGVRLAAAQADYGAARLTASLRQVSGQAIYPERVWAPRPAPRDPRRHQALLGCPVEYDAPFLRAWIPEAWWAMPLPARDRRLVSILERQVNDSLERLPAQGASDELGARAEQLVKEHLDHGRVPQLAEVARALGVAERTLRRRLSGDADGDGFARIVERHRQRAAEQLLRGSRFSLDEIAARLGYASVSAFHRAFKRWTGTTPASFRDASAP